MGSSIDYTKYDSNGNKISPYNSLLRSHFFGLSAKYVFREREKNFRPFIKVSVLTEIYTNYTNGFLLEGDYISNNEPSATYIYPFPGGEYVDYYYSDFYHSTPFIGLLQFGYNLKLVKNLRLNLVAGYSFRIMKTKYVTWDEGENF